MASQNTRKVFSMIKNFVLGMSLILALSGFTAAQSVAGAWRLDEIKTTGDGAKTAKFTNPNIFLFTKDPSSDSKLIFIFWKASDKP